jgi:hypothetical protein
MNAPRAYRLELDSSREPERRCARCCYAAIGTLHLAGGDLRVCLFCANELDPRTRQLRTTDRTLTIRDS